jgi:hypothetical protein
MCLPDYNYYRVIFHVVDYCEDFIWAQCIHCESKFSLYKESNKVLRNAFGSFCVLCKSKLLFFFNIKFDVVCGINTRETKIHKVKLTFRKVENYNFFRSLIQVDPLMSKYKKIKDLLNLQMKLLTCKGILVEAVILKNKKGQLKMTDTMMKFLVGIND